MERYLSYQNKSLFDYMEMPESIDKEVLENSILMELGEYEPLWSDPNFLQNMISIWAKKWQRTFKKWADALELEYNPIENYDRYEEWTDGSNHESSLEGSIKGTTNDSGSNTNQVSAYNESGFENKDKNEISQTTISDSGSTSKTKDSNSSTHVGRLHGNIGVTTSQQMLQSELDIARFNLYEQIVDIFAKEFCILVDD